jgi:hypothetical protein
VNTSLTESSASSLMMPMWSIASSGVMADL